MNNVLIDQSIVQLLYNLIHWILGINLIVFAYLEYRKLRAKASSERLNLAGPAVFTGNGLFFIAFVIIGHLIYLRSMNLSWQFDHEHILHTIIGIAMAIGGGIELLYRTKKLKHRAWHFALPSSLVVSGSLFLHPQHGLGSVLDYMTLYHRILAAALIICGLSLGAAWYSSKNKKVSYVSLIFIVAAGLIFTTYRHQYNTQANCISPNPNIHEVWLSDGKAEPEYIQAELCDQIRFVSVDDKYHHMVFGGHSHHSTYPGFEEQLLKPGEEHTVLLRLGGTFNFHDHMDDDIKGQVTVVRPQDMAGWRTLKY